jgi:hypothetical protein
VRETATQVEGQRQRGRAFEGILRDTLGRKQIEGYGSTSVQSLRQGKE